MDRADLELVLAIKGTGSMSQAAAQLRLSPPVVTKRLATLEAALGLKLFYRTTRRVAPTAEGGLLCERGLGLLEGFKQTEEALREQTREPMGAVRIAATFGFGRIWLGPALAEYQSLYPKVRVEVQLTEILPDLSSQGLDGAVWLWAMRANRTAQWSAKLLAHNQRVLVAAPSYLRQHRAPRTVDDLQQHECLVVRENDDPSSTWHLGAEGERRSRAVVVRGALSSNSGELVRDWCLAGRGIMLRSLWDVAPLLASGKLVRVLPGHAMRDADIQWLAPFRAQTPKRVRLLRDFLAAKFKSRPWEV